MSNKRSEAFTKLYESIHVRAMTGTRSRILRLVKAFPDRWDSESHFIRSAVQFYICHHDKELTRRKIQKRSKR